MDPISVSFPALGSTAVVATSEPGSLAATREAVEEVLERLDKACSRFRPDSEISALNAAEGQPVVVSPLMLDAVEAALRAARITDGDVDPTIGQALLALGYDRDFDELPEVAPRRPLTISAVPGWQTVVADRSGSTVQLARGVVLDLGATAKALGADRAAQAAFESAGCGVLVSLGGDVAIAGPAPASGWAIRVTDDHRAPVAAPGQTISLESGGLATSSTTARRWHSATGQVHHLLNPRTGRPADGPWRTVSVSAGSCLDANIASTAAVIRGARAVQWLESIGLPSRLVNQDGAVLHLAGWPSEGDDLPEAA